MLDPKLVIYAYQNGYFPMADHKNSDDIMWSRPSKRAIMPLDHRFHVPKNLLKLYQKNEYTFKINYNFEAVIRACADREDTWISESIIECYIALNKMGYTTSFEVYQNNELIGGLYGVIIGKVFFGESMFSKVSNVSKLALVFCVNELRKQKFKLLDSQILNHHTAQFGAYEVSNYTFMKKLKSIFNTYYENKMV